MMQWYAATLALAAMFSVGWPTASAQSDRPPDSVGPMFLETAASESLLEDAREALLDFRMPEAERLLMRLQKRSDGRIAASYHLASAAVLRFLMSDDEAEYKVFNERADSTKRLLSKEPASAWRDYLLAEVDLQRAVALAKQDDYIRAAWAARSAYKGFERVVAEFPDFYEPYKGLGILHLAIGSMPSSYRFILRILGYDGSIRLGLEELDMARTRSHFSSDEAAAYLALSHSMLYLSKDRALRLIGSIYERDAESVLVGYLYGYLLVSTRRTTEAVEVMERARRLAAAPSHFYIDYLDFFIAEATFRDGRFEEAVPHYRRYITEHPGNAGKAMAHLHIGMALEMTGRRKEAIGYYEDVTAARAFDTDEAARRAAEKLLAAPLSPRGRTLLEARCAYDSGRLAEAERLLKGVLADASAAAEQRAEAGYRLGRVYHAMERWAAAIDAYAIGIRYGSDTPSRWAPWGQFFIGKIHQRENRTEAARAAFKDAAAYGGRYDYHRALEQAIRANLQMIEAE